MNQQEIEELLFESDESNKNTKQIKKNNSQNIHQQFDQKYEDQFQQIDEIGQKKEIILKQEEIIKKENKFELESIDNISYELQQQIQKSYGSQNFDKITSPNHNHNNYLGKSNNDDDDLSEVKSQFINSSNLNVNMLIQSNSKQNLNNQQNVQNNKNKNKNRNQTKIIKNKEIDLKKILVHKNMKQKSKNSTNNSPIKNIITLVQTDKLINKVVNHALTDKQIKTKMKNIHKQTQERQQRKIQFEKKKYEQKNKQYELVKIKEEERKKKNKQILQQQLKKNKNNNKIKIIEQKQKIKNNNKQDIQILLPQTKTIFQFLKIKKQRNMKQKIIKQNIEQDNKNKLKILLNLQPKQQKSSINKAMFLVAKNNIKINQKININNQKKQQDTIQIKYIKQEIIKQRKFNLNKKQQIYQIQKNINLLKKKLKQKQKQLYTNKYNPKQTIIPKQQQQYIYSQLSVIEKFVTLFPQCQTTHDIFNILDSNKDGVLSLEEIKFKIESLQTQNCISVEVFKILDKNSDGNVSSDQFSFIIQSEIQKQKDYRRIMGQINISDPIQIQAKIIDMCAKIHYMNKKIQEEQIEQLNNQYTQKINLLQAKLSKIKVYFEKNSQKNQQKNININNIIQVSNSYKIFQEISNIQNKYQTKQKLLNVIKQKYKNNIHDKNIILSIRIEQNLLLQQQVYKIKNQIQEIQLRFLSLKKIENNKKGYLQRQTKQRKKMEEVHRKAQEYKIKLIDPTKNMANSIYAENLKFIAAVIMIQRNFRKKKAIQEINQKQKNKLQNH